MTTDAVRPDDPALADRAREWHGIYVHIPFCRRVCPYCDFAVVAGRDDLRPRYTDALLAEIALAEPFGAPPDAIAFGGGTPSRMPVADLAQVLGALVERFGIAPDAEISLEANPEDWTPEVASRLVEVGFNRVSLGVQSFDPAVLAALGRVHSPREAAAAVETARRAGFASVNLDLIFGTPVETAASWRTTVETALASGIDHLSAYALTVERGTPLSRSVQGGAPGPDPDVQADRYEWLLDAAAAAGLIRYETSNFAKPGSACRYNLITWAQGDYEGFGAAAHRHLGGARSWNVRRIDRYLERVEAGVRPESGSEALDGFGSDQERVVLGLRRAAGVVPGVAGAALLDSEPGRRLVGAGVLGERSDRLVATRPLLGDEVARAVLALTGPDC